MLYRSISLSLATLGLTAGTLLFGTQAAQAEAAPVDERAFADSVFSYERGTSNNWNKFSGDAKGGGDEWLVYDPTSALGQNNWDKEMVQGGKKGQWNKDIGVSLGKGGSLTLEFTDNYLTGSGNEASDLWIYEIGKDVEKTLISISQDGESWLNLGTANRKDRSQDSGVGIDIDAALADAGYSSESLFSFVRITDDATSGGHGGFKSGADIDAIAALSFAPKDETEVPEPGFLAGIGILGYSLLRQRKSLA